MKNDSLQEFVKLRRKLAEEKASIETRLRQINEALGELPAAPAAGPVAKAGPGRRKRGLSAEGRARIAAAQRARWAATRGQSASAESAEKPARKGKRRMSAAARKAISEAAKRRWADKKAKGENRL